jgi:hypothetical protein
MQLPFPSHLSRTCSTNERTTQQALLEQLEHAVDYTSAEPCHIAYTTYSCGCLLAYGRLVESSLHIVCHTCTVAGTDALTAVTPTTSTKCTATSNTSTMIMHRLPYRASVVVSAACPWLLKRPDNPTDASLALPLQQTAGPLCYMALCWACCAIWLDDVEALACGPTRQSRGTRGRNVQLA